MLYGQLFIAPNLAIEDGRDRAMQSTETEKVHTNMQIHSPIQEESA